MDYIKLCDVCDFQGGSQPPKDEWSFTPKDGYVRMLQIRDFTQGERVIPEYIKLTNTTKICEADDILIARYIERQNQFAAFVKQVDKLRIAVQKALDETQMLFDSLMQKYFE